MDGIWEARAGSGVVGVEGGERSATVLKTVGKSGGEGGELDARRVEVSVVRVRLRRAGETRGRDVRGGRVRPGRVDGRAGAFRDRGVLGSSVALVWAGLEAAVRGGRARHPAGVVVDLGGVRPENSTASDAPCRERASTSDTQSGRSSEEAKGTYRRRASNDSGSVSGDFVCCLERGQRG